MLLPGAPRGGVVRPLAPPTTLAAALLQLAAVNRDHVADCQIVCAVAVVAARVVIG